MSERKSLYAPKLFVYISRHIQAFRISLSHLSVSMLASIMTFLVLGIALALPMGLKVMLQNMSVVTSNLNASAQISIYLKRNISSRTLNSLRQKLSSDTSIAHFYYVSPKKGLKEFQQNMGENQLLSQFKENPLPGLFVITPKTQVKDSFQLAKLMDRFNRLSGVDKAQLDMIWLQRLNAMLSLAHQFLFAIMLIFAIGVILVIGNTIRLTTQNHKEEILVIKLIGGSNSFIRRPFLYDGIIFGFVGAIMAWLMIDFTLWWLQGPVSKLATLYHSHFELSGMGLKTTFYLIIAGILLGYVGSWSAVSKHINEIEPE